MFQRNCCIFVAILLQAGLGLVLLEVLLQEGAGCRGAVLRREAEIVVSVI
jgi:hypothetical protein